VQLRLILYVAGVIAGLGLAHVGARLLLRRWRDRSGPPPEAGAIQPPSFTASATLFIIVGVVTIVACVWMIDRVSREPLRSVRPTAVFNPYPP